MAAKKIARRSGGARVKRVVWGLTKQGNRTSWTEVGFAWDEGDAIELELTHFPVNGTMKFDQVGRVCPKQRSVWGRVEGYDLPWERVGFALDDARKHDVEVQLTRFPVEGRLKILLPTAPAPVGLP